MSPAPHVEIIRRAYRIAVRDLRACYNPDGIIAGRLHFNAYWSEANTSLRTCHPVYPLRQVLPFYILAGIPDYHRTLIWPWLGTLHTVNKHRMGNRGAALADLSRIGECYLGRNAVAEVHELGLAEGLRPTTVA